MGKLVDLTGEIFGRLLVIKRAEDYTDKNGKHYTRWLCRCIKDGNELIVRTTNLKSGHVKSCGCYNKELTSERNRKDLTGQKFGKLIVLEIDHVEKKIGIFAGNVNAKKGT